MKEKIRKNIFASCMPLTPATEKEMDAHLSFAQKFSPDFLEWRRDYFMDGHNEGQKRMLSQLKLIDIPLIYTFRSPFEGGIANLSDDNRFEAIRWAILSDELSYLDLEVHHLPPSFFEIQILLSKRATGLILSAHYFDCGLRKQEIEQLFSEMENYGPDVMKLAQTPQSNNEAQRLIENVKVVSEKYDQPIIHVLMGPYGKMTRIFPEKCGGSLTYVSGLASTAPGQLKLKEIKNLREYHQNHQSR